MEKWSNGRSALSMNAFDTRCTVSDNVRKAIKGPLCLSRLSSTGAGNFWCILDRH